VTRVRDLDVTRGRNRGRNRPVPRWPADEAKYIDGLSGLLDPGATATGDGGGLVAAGLCTVEGDQVEHIWSVRNRDNLRPGRADNQAAPG